MRSNKQILHLQVYINCLPFSLSIQLPTTFAILSYEKQDLAEAEGHKTEIGEDTRSAEGEGQKISHWIRTAYM